MVLCSNRDEYVHCMMMGQRLAKRRAIKGVLLYKQQKYSEALLELAEACRRFDKDEDQFGVLGYLCLVNLELGRFHDVLSCAKRQTILSDTMADNFRAEAIFNMARAYERLAEYRTSISLCSRSVTNEENVSPLSGYTHLCLANCYFGLSEIRKCLKHYDRASHIARVLIDPVLECRVYMGLGRLFLELQDYVTSLQHYVRASEIVRQFSTDHPSVKYQRCVAVEMTVVYSKLGRLGEALEICEESMKQALTHGDRMTQAKCLLNFAEIHRVRQNFERAYPRYQSAYSIAKETGDRKCQLEVLSGMALCAYSAQDLEQAVELYEKAVRLSKEIGSKLDTLKCCRELCDIYMLLDVADMSRVHGFQGKQLVHELQLYCGVCNEVLGDKDEKIRPLPCYHMIHERCMVHLYRPTSSSHSLQRRPCPTCRHRNSMNPTSDSEL